jgi:hypothetical protein
MFTVAAILIFVAILILWFGRSWLIAYGVPSYRRAVLTPEEISAGAGRITIALASALIVLALIIAALGELTRVHRG